MTPRLAPWTAGVLAVTLVAVTARADTVRVGNEPAPLREKPTVRAAVVLTLPAGREVEAFDRDGDWVWVIVAAEPGGATRAGWISRHALAATATRVPLARELPAAPAPLATTNLVFTAEKPWTEPAAATGPSSVAPGAEVVVSTPRGAGLADIADAARAASAAAAAARLERAASSTGATDTRRRAKAASFTRSSDPPEPVGGLPRNQGSALGTWILPRSLRLSFGFTYQSADVRQALGSMSERLRGGGATIAAGFAVLDPRILTVDFSGDLQVSRTASDASLASFRNNNGFRSYRLDLGVLTGLKAPLRLFADRVSSSSDQQPSGATIDPARHNRGVRRGVGFTWDITPDRLPRIQVSASTGHQQDDRNYLFGYSSTNDEQRAEIRAGRDHARGRYEIDFTHGNFVYDVPAAGVRSATASDVFQATGRLTPSGRLTLDAHARATRFRFGIGAQESRVNGTGADVAARYAVGAHSAVSGRYSFSNNAVEAALSGRLPATQPGATPVTTSAQLQERTRFQDGEGRLEYATRPLTAAAVVKTVSFGVPSYLSTTLSTLTTAGALLRTEHSWHGLAWHAGGDAALGRALSNRREGQPYHEAGVEAGISRDVSTRLRFGADASVRRIGRLDFFPVNLDARNASVRVETMRPGWARLRAVVTRFDNLRDVLYSDSRDRHTGYSLGLGGTRYELTADIDQADTHSLLLDPRVLGSRPDAAILIASRPDFFRNLLAASDRTRVLGLQVRPFGGLQVQARVRRQDQAYPGVFSYRLQGAQAWATYQVREVQLEFGWEYFDSSTSFGGVRDRRVYFRVRRDMTFF